jgi:uncharacterized protein (DUF1015 family)
VSPVFSLYSDPKKSISSIFSIPFETVLFEAQDSDNAFHRLWPVHDSASIELMRNTLADKDIFIADGHHRYETALEYKYEMDRQNSDSQAQKPYDYVMMFLANMDEEGITLLPTHRLIHHSVAPTRESLENYFIISEFHFNSSNEKEVRDTFFKAINETVKSIGYYGGDKPVYYLLKRHKECCDIDTPEVLKDLDVTVLERFIFDKIIKPKEIIYEKDPDKVILSVQKGHYDAGFILSPPHVNDVKRVALAHERMPAKSTYFYPKLLTGMVMNVFSD